MKTSPLTRYLTFQVSMALKHIVKIHKASDIEQLHKFRVAIRRSRSLLKFYMKKHYAIADVLKVIVQQTNTLRELDVLLLEIDSKRYAKLTHKVTAYRDEQFNLLWHDGFVKNSIQTLNQLYDDILELNVEYSESKLISKSINHYHKTMQNFYNIPHDSSDELFHELRIEFKIARYTLEFLSETALEDEEHKTQQCKQIQDHLGLIQDRSNQYEWIQQFCNGNDEIKQECKSLLKQYKKELKQLKKKK